MIGICVFVIEGEKRKRVEDGERTFGRGLGGTSRGRGRRKRERERRMKREGCVVVDFAMGAFNIKPWAINGQASKRASG